ncbi:hypothetical protein [Chromatium okenii]|uniref:hypothetical protein n=1 Tax=Chromatium okenii TaxID=61644 RepID=UPI0026EF73F1|nr:hypothetical protein [Chromatium okenii]MBV5309039.1 hypothetical protein [Chromatium okenii]
MALLTKKQIEIITLIALNQSTSKDLYDELCEWNEKQTTQQIEVDWNDAPKNATKAALRLHWITEDKESGAVLWSGSLDSVTFERPAPVITPHPHAEIMAKYAEVAARKVDPWVEFEFRVDKREWETPTTGISFHLDFEYRHIGDEK